MGTVHDLPQDAESKSGILLRLFLVSVVALYLEMLLIRWVSTEIRIFAYLQSSVLIACLMGLGIGCFNAWGRINLYHTVAPVLLITGLLSAPVIRDFMASVTLTLAEIGDFHIWFNDALDNTTTFGKATSIFSAVTAAAFLLFLVWFAFIPLGQLIGRLIDDCAAPVPAYSVNIFGSLVGILLFTTLSAWQTLPILWLLILVVLFAAISVFHGEMRPPVILLLALIPATAGLGMLDNEAEEVVWSPYQKLSVVKIERIDEKSRANLRYPVIRVNNTPYQVIIDFRPETIAVAPTLYPESRIGLSQYDLPLLIKPEAKRMLILGAGSGNDAAAAIRGSDAHITAVDIDPAIIAIGRRLHPERPYQNPRVRLVNDDARSFMATARETYDLISFGLVDSHTSGTMTNARLDHYVYTLESIARAKKLLNPGGVMTLAFEADKQFLVDRLARTIKQVFGREPLMFRVPSTTFGPGAVMFVTGNDFAIDAGFRGNPRMRNFVASLMKSAPVSVQGPAGPTTDDWPYLYLKSHHIPPLFAILAAIMAVIFFVCGQYVKITGTLKSWRRREGHFFFLGAAFMLFEVLMVNKAAVVLGNVWTVNSVVIAGILSMILVANLVKHLWPNIPVRPVYILLIASCCFLYLFDLAQLATLPYGQKVVALAVISAFPMLFAGILFIDSFARTENKARALGANLFGALVGGILQTITFVTGLQLLLLLVALLYASAGALSGFRRTEAKSIA